MEVSHILFLTVLYILIYLIYRWNKRNQDYWKNLGVPSVPSSIPYIGNLWPVLTQRKSFGAFYSDIYEKFSDASMVGMYSCGNHELMIKDAELVKTILQTNFSSFQENAIHFDVELDPLLKRNPFINTGDKWKNERAVLTNTMSAAKLKHMSLTMRQIGAKFSKYLSQNMRNNQFEVEAQYMFARFTAEVVSSVGFGIDGKCFEKESGTFVSMGSKIFQPTGMKAFQLFITFFVPPLAKLFKTSFLPKEFQIYCRKLIKDVLEMRRKTGIQGNDFVHHISELCKAEFGEIDEEFIACHATSFYVDGYLTSSYTLAFLAYDIAKRPEIQDKLRMEIKETLKKHQNEMTYEALQDMKYLDLVIKESMRVSPAVSSMRKMCTSEFKLVGSDGTQCTVKPGLHLILCPLGLHYDPKYWQDPEIFRPERFDEKHEYPKFAYIPFGGGPRVCVGMRMALLQMKYAIVTLINNYSISLSYKMKEPLVFDCSAIMNIPVNGIWIDIKQL